MSFSPVRAPKKRSHAAGNALFLILIAIFLMGGLTALLTRTGSQSDDTGDTEQMSIQVSELLKYAAGLQSGMQMLRDRGCGENGISFYDASFATNYTNASAKPECFMFTAQGAGIKPKPVPKSWLVAAPLADSGQWEFSRGYCINGIGTGTTSCTIANTDLLFLVHSLTKEFCLAINKKLGVASVNGNPPSDGIGRTIYAGNFTPTGTGDAPLVGEASKPSAVPLIGKKAGCLMDDDTGGSGFYHFYSVLIPR